MTNEEIIAMARKAWDDTGESWVVDGWFADRAHAFKAFSDAVIKAHEAKLITGAGEPAHHIMVDGRCIGYYSVEQVAAAVAKAKAVPMKYKRMAFNAELQERIVALESTLKLALEALEMVVVDVKTTPNVYEAQRRAIRQIKEALK